MSQEIQILKSAQAGRSKAQIEIYNLYYKAVFNSCYRILYNTEDAEDICHDTFILIFDAQVIVPEDANLTAWIKRMAINKSIDLLRRQKKLFFDNEAINTKEPDEVPEYNFYSQQTKLILKGIEQLPKQYRLIINLFLIEGYDHSEISKILDIRNSTSRSQLTRAKQKLKEFINRNK